MINHTISSVKVSATLKVSDDKEIDSTSATDALHLLFEATANNMVLDVMHDGECRDVNISETCAYNWQEPYVELEYDTLAEANERSADDFKYLAGWLRKLYRENEERRKESEALQAAYDELDQIRCDIENGKDRRHNEVEIDGAMGMLQTKIGELAPINAAW